MPRPRFAGLLLALVLLAAGACTSPDERRRMTFERADLLLAHGDQAAAVAALESFLVYDPRDIAVTVRLAALDLESDRAHQALRRLETLPSGGVRGEEYFDVLARALVHAGRLERALPMLLARAEASDDVDPKLVAVLVKRSVEHHDLLLPELPDAWRARRVEGLVAAGLLDPAIDQWRLLAAGEAKARLLESLLQAALDRGRLDLLRTAQEVHADPPTPWKLLARHRLLLERDDEGEAAEVERQFVRAFPGHPRRFDILLSLARRENRSGRHEQALRLADEASTLRPSEVTPLLEKALALRALGEPDEAESLLELVLALDPDHPAAKLLLRRGDERRQGESGGTRVESLELRLGPGGSG